MPLPQPALPNVVTPRSRTPFRHLGWLRGALGGTIGVAVAGAVGMVLIGANDPGLPWLVAPTGASAVLVFAVPASPLAQPWPVLGGSLLSAVIGLVVGHVFAVPLLAASLAAGLAIGAMSLARCLHPPGGACALLYALGAAGHDAWGALHLITIVVNVLTLTSLAWLYNNATGHAWPHHPPHGVAVMPGTLSAHVHEALSAALAEWNEVVDADIEDLDAIVLAVEQRIRARQPDAPPPEAI